jgi:cyclic-di-AMP phosphodiesterase PgpH
MAKGRRNHIISFVGFIATAMLCALLMPRERAFRFEYQAGKSWAHRDLIAPFDFPIYKTLSELEEQRTRIRKDRKFLFSQDSSAKAESKLQLRDGVVLALNEKVRVFSSRPEFQHLIVREEVRDKYAQRWIEKGEKLLDQAFEKGVVMLSEELLNKTPDIIVYVLTNQNKYEERFLGSLMDIEKTLYFFESGLKGEDSLTNSILLPVLSRAVRPNLFLDREMIQKILDEDLMNLPETKGYITKGTLIVSTGDIISPEKYNLLESLRREYSSQQGSLLNSMGVFAGQAVYSIMVFGFLYFFLVLFRRAVIRNFHMTFSILTLSLLIVFLARLSREFPGLNIYVIPFTILPILLRSF